MGLFKDNNQKEMHFIGDNLASALEALLFLHGDPIELDKAAKFLGVKSEKVKEVALELKQMLDISGRGLTIIFHNDKIQLTTRADFSKMLDELVKADLSEALTPAALETLAIVAYGGPITRMEIDFIRGVNSSFILRSLLVRGLVERKPDPKRANTFLYQVTMDFLRHMGVSSIEKLPEYEKYKEFEKLFVGGEIAPESAKSKEENENESDS